MESTFDDDDLEFLLTHAVTAKEHDIQAEVEKALVAQAAMLMGRGGIMAVAETWACSEHTVRRYAAYGEKLPLDDIKANDPRLFNACIEADEAGGKTAAEWYHKAVAEGWSAGDLRDAADLKRGKRTSRVPWLDGRASVINVEDAEDEQAYVLLRAQRPTGQQPEAVEVRAYRVLREAENA